MFVTEVLKQPLKTTVALNAADFSHLQVQDGLHIIISVKDFKAIVTHAETLGATLTATYSKSNMPLQFLYEKDAMTCQFTLATSGENRASAKTTNGGTAANEVPHVEPWPAAPQAGVQRPLAPPPRPEVRRIPKTLGKRTTQTALASSATRHRESESLFVSQDADDGEAWDPPNYENTEESLGWDVGESTTGVHCSSLSKLKLTRPSVRYFHGYRHPRPLYPQLMQIQGPKTTKVWHRHKN
jgi:cell cycle checkpoint control protein RAD9A